MRHRERASHTNFSDCIQTNANDFSGAIRPDEWVWDGFDDRFDYIRRYEIVRRLSDVCEDGSDFLLGRFEEWDKVRVHGEKNQFVRTDQSSNQIQDLNSKFKWEWVVALTRLETRKELLGESLWIVEEMQSREIDDSWLVLGSFFLLRSGIVVWSVITNLLDGLNSLLVMGLGRFSLLVDAKSMIQRFHVCLVFIIRFDLFFLIISQKEMDRGRDELWNRRETRFSKDIDRLGIVPTVWVLLLAAGDSAYQIFFLYKSTMTCTDFLAAMSSWSLIITHIKFWRVLFNLLFFAFLFAFLISATICECKSSLKCLSWIRNNEKKSDRSLKVNTSMII